MRKVWHIAQHEYIVNVRRTGFIVFTALVPVLGLIGLIVAGFFGGQASAFLERQFTGERQAVGVVDEFGAFTPILPEYQDGYQIFPDRDAGRAALEADQIGALLWIAKDYLQEGIVTVYTKGGGLSAAAMEDSASRRAFFVYHLLRDAEDASLRERLARPMQTVLVDISAEARGGQGAGVLVSFMVPYVLGFLLVITVFTSSGYLLRSVAEEKTNRVIEILLSSVSSRELLAGKVVGLGALGLTQIAVWLATVFVLSGGMVGLLGVAIPLLTRPDVFVLAVVYYLLGFLVYAALMGSAGALGTTMHESQQMGGIFSFFAAIPFFVVGFMLSNPNILLVRILSWFPLTAPTMMLLRLPMTEVPAVDIVASIAGLLVACPLVLWLGGKVFRMGLLMYGQRPSLVHVLRYLRQG